MNTIEKLQAEANARHEATYQDQMNTRHISWAHHVIEEMTTTIADGTANIQDLLTNLAYLKDRVEQLTDNMGLTQDVEEHRAFMAEVNSKA